VLAGRARGFLEMVRQGTPVCHIAEQQPLELQWLAYMTPFSARVPTKEPGISRWSSSMGRGGGHLRRQAGGADRRGILAGEPAGRHRRRFLHHRDQEHPRRALPGPSTMAIVERPASAAITVIRLTTTTSCSSRGTAYQKKIQASLSRAGLIAAETAGNRS